MSGFSLGFDIGLKRSALDPKAHYKFVNAEAAALISRFSVVPDDTRKSLIDDRFTAGKKLSFWSKLDALWVHAAHAPEAARLNWLGPIYDCLPINNPAFTADRGYMGNGSSSYLDTQFNPATAVGAKYSKDSGALGIRSNTDNVGTGSLAGFYDTAAAKGTTINPRTTAIDNQAAFRINQGSSVALSPGASSPSAIGMFVANRVVSGGNIRGHRNGVQIASVTEPSLAPANGNFRLGSINGSSFRACQFSMGFISGGLTNQEVLDLFNWFEPYRAALGIA